MALSAEYIAGFVDGEGCITAEFIAKAKRPRARYNYYRIRVQISNTNKEVLEQLKEDWGGQIYFHDRGSKAGSWKPAYHWTLWSRSTVEFLKQILPHLIIKRKVAELALQLQGSYKMGGRHRYITPEEEQTRHDLYLAIRACNKRGPAHCAKEEVD